MNFRKHCKPYFKSCSNTRADGPTPAVKMVKAMKLTLLLLTVFFLQSAAEGLSQKVTLHLKDATMQRAFRELEKQTQFGFLYTKSLLHGMPRLTIDADNLSIEDVLIMCFRNSPLTFSIVEKTIVVKPADRNNTSLPAGPVTVKGRVTDESGNPIAGVSVVVKGSTTGTVTDNEGRFAFEAPGIEKLRIEFSYVGYESAVIDYNGNGSVEIKLRAAEKKLDQVVVVGYGSSLKKDVTGSLVRASLKDKGESPAVSLATALQGVVPGLNVGAVTKAGRDPLINIRGRTSISGSNSPLIILDGIIYRGNLVDINPADIESVDVLKDASATAVYGSQASNGVIILTSRQGRNKKTTVEYNTAFSTQSVTNKKMLPENGAGFLRRIGDRFLAESRTGPDLLTPNPSWDPSSKFFGPEILAGYQKGVETNWWNLLTNRHPGIQNHNLSITGKTDAVSYFMSFGYTGQQNVVKNDNYKRYNFRLNLETRITEWLKAGVRSFLSVNDYSGASPSIGDVVRMPPQVPYRDDQGNTILFPYRGFLNPLLQTDQQDLDKRNNLFSNLYAELTVPFVKGLSYRINFSPSQIAARRYNFNAYDENLTGSASKTNESQYSETIDHIFTFRRTFKDHSVNATAVYGSEKITFEGTTAKSVKFLNSALGYNYLGAGQAGLQTAGSAAWQESSLYSMARIAYGYKNRYQFTGTVRRDGFSGFGKNNKYGTFPSAAVSWHLSGEPWFVRMLPSVQEFKLRASYGVNGNRTVGRYQTLSQIKSGVASGYLYGDGSTAEAGQYIVTLPNDNLKWETTKSLNLGADFSFLKGRLSGSVDYYNANTYDLLYNVDIPVVNGFNSTLRNIGKLKNNGIEFSLSGSPVNTEKFKWTVNANFSRNRNQVVSILGTDANNDGREDDLISSKLFIGHPYGVVYDFNITGMWQVRDYQAGSIPAGFTYGTYKVEDLNKDGSYSADKDRKILGYTDPSYRFSLQNTFQYRNFDLRIFVNAIQGGKKYYYGQPGATLNNPDNAYGFNFFKWDYWTPENPNARYRQIGYYSVALGGSEFSPYIQRSFIRLQDVTLSYNLPATLYKKIKISRAKLFINGANLYTLTKWDGWDPETGTGLDFDAYPFLKSFSAGFNIEF